MLNSRQLSHTFTPEKITLCFKMHCLLKVKELGLSAVLDKYSLSIQQLEDWYNEISDYKRQLPVAVATFHPKKSKTLLEPEQAESLVSGQDVTNNAISDSMKENVPLVMQAKIDNSVSQSSNTSEEKSEHSNHLPMLETQVVKSVSPSDMRKQTEEMLQEFEDQFCEWCKSQVELTVGAALLQAQHVAEKLLTDKKFITENWIATFLERKKVRNESKREEKTISPTSEVLTTGELSAEKVALLSARYGLKRAYVMLQDINDTCPLESSQNNSVDRVEPVDEDTGSTIICSNANDSPTRGVSDIEARLCDVATPNKLQKDDKEHQQIKCKTDSILESNAGVKQEASHIDKTEEVSLPVDDKRTRSKSQSQKHSLSKEKSLSTRASRRRSSNIADVQEENVSVAKSTGKSDTTSNASEHRSKLGKGVDIEFSNSDKTKSKTCIDQTSTKIVRSLNASIGCKTVSQFDGSTKGTEQKNVVISSSLKKIITKPSGGLSPASSTPVTVGIVEAVSSVGNTCSNVVVKHASQPLIVAKSSTPSPNIPKSLTALMRHSKNKSSALDTPIKGVVPKTPDDTYSTGYFTVAVDEKGAAPVSTPHKEKTVQQPSVSFDNALQEAELAILSSVKKKRKSSVSSSSIDKPKILLHSGSKKIKTDDKNKLKKHHNSSHKSQSSKHTSDQTHDAVTLPVSQEEHKSDQTKPSFFIHPSKGIRKLS